MKDLFIIKILASKFKTETYCSKIYRKRKINSLTGRRAIFKKNASYGYRVRKIELSGF